MIEHERLVLVNVRLHALKKMQYKPVHIVVVALLVDAALVGCGAFRGRLGALSA